MRHEEYSKAFDTMKQAVAEPVMSGHRRKAIAAAQGISAIHAIHAIKIPH